MEPLAGFEIGHIGNRIADHLVLVLAEMPHPVDLHALEAEHRHRGGFTDDAVDDAVVPPGHVFFVQARLHADDCAQVFDRIAGIHGGRRTRRDR